VHGVQSIPTPEEHELLLRRIAVFLNGVGVWELADDREVVDRFALFTSAARRALRYARDESRRLNHRYIGTEHLLLGLLRLRSGMPSRVLVRFGVDLRRARDGVAFTIGPGNQPFDGPLGLTPRAKKVMELAIEASRQAHEVSVCPEHLLLAIINEGAGIATGILEAMGVQLSPLADRVRAASSAASKAR